MDKTNVMRILDVAKIAYKRREYDNTVTDGEEVARLAGLAPETVFKTLVTVGSDRRHYVFEVPVNRELDLKKAAKAVGVKNVEMLKQKELFPLTGYVHGGCSPIGMKKKFVTVIDSSAENLAEIAFSGGRVGEQVSASPRDLAAVVSAVFRDIAGTGAES
jgi:Cys-tRNA(Pro)/Cys-tRNA(Cys) deacylase